MKMFQVVILSHSNLIKVSRGLNRNLAAWLTEVSTGALWATQRGNYAEDLVKFYTKEVSWLQPATPPLDGTKYNILDL